MKIRLYDEDDVMFKDQYTEGSNTFEPNNKVKKSFSLTHSELANTTWGKIVFGYGRNEQTSDSWIFDLTENGIEFRK